MKIPLSVLALVSIATAFARAADTPAPASRLVSPDADGRLAYAAYDDRGSRLPDFSHAGYAGGGVPLPSVAVVRTLTAEPGDNHERIQAALDEIAALPPDADGWRGALLLRAGRYPVGETIRLLADGVVLRGEGDEAESGTVLVATKRAKHDLVAVGGTGQWKGFASGTAQITDAYVPVGANRVRVDHPERLKVGDRVIVRRASGEAWISAIGMDRIPPRPDGKPVTQWRANTQDLLFDRTVTDIEGDAITVDVPLTDAFAREFGGGRVYRYTFPERRRNIGIESLRFESEFDPAVRSTEKAGPVTLTDVAVDEAHGWNAVFFDAVENAWARDLTSVNFANACVSLGRSALRVTVDDCRSLDPVSRITGGRRYAFPIAGQQILVKNCYASGARHAFVLDSRVPGPNVYLDCVAENNFSTSEPHHRWASGALWDNVTVSGPYAWLQAVNRGWLGTGHGWAGAQMVFWNCRAALIAVQKPPFAQNFAIGARAPFENRKLVEIAVGEINRAAGTALPPVAPLWGDGHIESPDRPVFPRSLYEAQLQERLGAR
jgi:hypothetical protein